MTTYRKISELPHAQLPYDDEILLPIFIDHPRAPVKQTTINDLVEAIKKRVIEDGSIDIIMTEDKIRFVSNKEIK